MQNIDVPPTQMDFKRTAWFLSWELYFPISFESQDKLCSDFYHFSWVQISYEQC